jgi:hypothetical protein
MVRRSSSIVIDNNENPDELRKKIEKIQERVFDFIKNSLVLKSFEEATDKKKDESCGICIGEWEKSNDTDEKMNIVGTPMCVHMFHR